MLDAPSLSSVLAAGNVAVVTGAASGIGLAAACKLAQLGLKIVLADLEGPALTRAVEQVTSLAAAGNVISLPTDVSRLTDIESLRDATLERFGPVSLLMNNAGVGNNPGLPWEDGAAWKRLVDVNLWGVVHGVGAFVPGMLAAGKPAMVVNTGSKQGITSPPGNAAYNMSKAALRNYTESVAHALRAAAAGRVSAHLLIPGFTFTGMTGANEKPAAAWTSEQVIDFMLESLARGDFYILCPDHAVERRLDERRMQWSIDDIIKNRPALSRWHPSYEAEFAEFVKSGP